MATFLVQLEQGKPVLTLLQRLLKATDIWDIRVSCRTRKSL